MKFDSRKQIKYSQNREPLRIMGMEFSKGYIPKYVKYKGHERELVVWFNYGAIQNKYGEWENPFSGNDFLNIYSDDNSEIEEIIPTIKANTSNDDNLIVINFKKSKKTELYFTGLYVVTKRVNRSAILKRISYTFDTDNIYLIEPTDEYYLLKEAKRKEPFSENINKFITSDQDTHPNPELKEKTLKNNLELLENLVDDELNYNLMKEDDAAEYRLIEPRIEVDPQKQNSYKRNRQIAINAIVRNGRVCDVDKNHKLFLKKDNRKYIEIHHIIPMAAQKYYDIPLDREENIACLCPMCHREIHYGKNGKQILESLLSKHINDLEKVGLYVSFDELSKYY